MSRFKFQNTIIILSRIYFCTQSIFSFNIVLHMQNKLNFFIDFNTCCYQIFKYILIFAVTKKPQIIPFDYAKPMEICICYKSSLVPKLTCDLAFCLKLNN